MDTLLQLAHAACETARKAGAEFVDVSATRGRSVEVELENNAIKSSDVTNTCGVSIRAFVAGGVGAASTGGLEENDVLAAARSAAELAQAANPDPDFKSLPGPPDAYPEVTGLYDPRIAALDVGEVVRFAVDNIDSARQVDDRVIVSGGAGLRVSERVLVNSVGVEVTSRETNLGCSIFATILAGDEIGCYFDEDEARMLADFEPDGIGAKAAEQALSFLGARSLPSAELPLVLGPFSSHALIRGLCAQANAEDVQRKRSYLAGKKGARIGSELLTLVDDPLISRGLNSARADLEGFPHRTLTVVDHGVLATYLHNSYTAGKSGEPNTGHSTRGGISPTNVVPTLGDRTAAELMADVSEGLYVNWGHLVPDGVTGQVSALVDFGFKIERGELAYPVKNTMVGADMFALLDSLEGVSSDYREEPGTIMPTLIFGKVKVAGAE